MIFPPIELPQYVVVFESPRIFETINGYPDQLRVNTGQGALRITNWAV